MSGMFELYVCLLIPCCASEPSGRAPECRASCCLAVSTVTVCYLSLSRARRRGEEGGDVGEGAREGRKGGCAGARADETQTDRASKFWLVGNWRAPTRLAA